MNNINMRFDNEQQYREEIERLTVIIENTPSEVAMRRAANKRMRLQKELFILIQKDI